MTTLDRTVVVHRDADVLAEAVAARLLTRLVDCQAVRGGASVVLTGGGVGIAALAALSRSPARAAVDWRAVEVWWGDERFLPSGDPDRNETQARTALLDALDLEPGRVHPIAGPGPGAGVGAGHDEPHLSGCAQRAEPQRDAAGRGLGAAMDPHDQTVVVGCRRLGEDRRGVALGAHAEQQDVERRQLVVGWGRSRQRLRVELGRLLG